MQARTSATHASAIACTHTHACTPPRTHARAQIMQRVEAILYAATQEEGRQALMEAQREFAGGVFLEAMPEGGEEAAPVEG